MDLLYSAAAIDDRIQDIAARLNQDFAGHNQVHIITVMNGAFMFAADLARKLTLPVVIHFTGGSYFDGPIKREVGLNPENIPQSFGNAPVLLIEDILDSGNSIQKVRQILADRHAKEISVVSLLKRQSTRVQADHVAFTIPDEMFVVGYGLDLDGRYRELKDIYHLASAPTGNTRGSC